MPPFKNLFHLFFTMLCAASFSFCPGTVFARQLIVKTYSVQDGLVANPVRCIFQDSKGFIWIGTWEGLSKYDGHQFTNFTTINGLGFNLVNDMYEGKDGKLYVAENNGNIDIIVNDAVQKNPVNAGSPINHFFKGHDKKIYVGTDAYGLAEFRDGKVLRVQQADSSSVISFAPFNDSLLITGASNFGFRILDRRFNVVASLPVQSWEDNYVFTDSKKRVWIRTWEGLKLTAPDQRRKTAIRLLPLPAPFNIPALAGVQVTDMLEDRAGNFWIGTHKGLIKIEAGGRKYSYTVNDGLPADHVYCLFQDRENNIWVGTQRGACRIVTANNIQVFKAGAGLAAEEIADLVPYDDGRLALVYGPERMMQEINRQTFAISGGKATGWEDYLAIALKSKRSLQLVSDEILRIVYPNLKVSDQRSLIYAVAKNSRGHVFIGMQKGILYKTDKYRTDTTLPVRVSTLLFDTRGNLWVGSWYQGLYRLTPRYEGDSLTFEVKDFSNLCPDKYIRSNFVDSKGNLWFGTRNHGLIRLTENSKGEYESLAINLSHGLVSNFVRTFAEDARGNIWVGTYNGLSKLIPAEEGYRVFNFSKVNNFFSQVNAIYPDKDNVIWCATYPGLARFRDELMDTLPTGQVYITNIKAADIPGNAIGKQNLSLKHHQNQVQFEFSLPSFINENEIRYSYRLLGSGDAAWSKPVGQHQVYFASLQPGEYRFEVRAIGLSGKPGAVTNYLFTIHKPFWTTAWFIGVCCFLLGSLLYWLYRYRIRQLMKLHQVRNAIATDLHDDIGSTLTNISILSELSRKTLQQPVQAEKFLSRISEEVSYSSQALDDIIWSVNTQNDSLDQTLARMRRYAAELLDNASINCHIEMDANVQDKKINMDLRRDLYLVFKESLNNVFKHAGATEVYIKSYMDNNRLHLMIRDNGKGFNTQAGSHRNGLKNLQARVQKWKGGLQISSGRDKGTTIYLQLPV